MQEPSEGNPFGFLETPEGEAPGVLRAGGAGRHCASEAKPGAQDLEGFGFHHFRVLGWV